MGSISTLIYTSELIICSTMYNSLVLPSYLPQSVNLEMDAISVTFLNKEKRYFINNAGVLALIDLPCVKLSLIPGLFVRLIEEM